MPNWKKVVTSGSNARLNSLVIYSGSIELTSPSGPSGDLTVNGGNIYVDMPGAVHSQFFIGTGFGPTFTGTGHVGSGANLTGSFSGSFTGDGKFIHGISSASYAITASYAKNVGSGIYTPSGFGIANITSLVLTGSQYNRIGNEYTVYGRAEVTPTSINTLTEFRISLPSSPTFVSEIDCIGTCIGDPGSAQGLIGIVCANVSNDQAHIKYRVGNSTVKANIYYHFMYKG